MFTFIQSAFFLTFFYCKFVLFIFYYSPCFFCYYCLKLLLCLRLWNSSLSKNCFVYIFFSRSKSMLHLIFPLYFSLCAVCCCYGCVKLLPRFIFTTLFLIGNKQQPLVFSSFFMDFAFTSHFSANICFIQIKICDLVFNF